MRYPMIFEPKTSYSLLEKWLNFALFPFRAVIQNPNESWGPLLCLRDERMHYVKAACKGKVLDIGCGPGNVFIRKFVGDESVGVDFHAYEGLQPEQVVEKLPFPFPNALFDTATLIANVNHIPTSIIDQEFAEIARVLKPEGRLVITRIGLLVSFLTHNVVHIQSKISSRYYDMDTDRGMEEDERLTVSHSEINALAEKHGMRFVERRPFWTQWALNEVLIFEKTYAKN